MNRKLINWLGLTGLLSFVSYAAAVICSPMAYPGYNWMAQAVSDLSADSAPSKMLWTQLSAFYGIGGMICVVCVSIYVSEKKIGSKLFRTGIYLFAIMNLVTDVGYKMFPLADSGKEIESPQEVMHIVVTAAVVVLSIVSLVLLIIAGCKDKRAGSVEKKAGDVDKRTGSVEKKAGDVDKKAGDVDKTVRGIGIWAAIALVMMFIGAIGTGAAPPEYFGIVERFSVFAAVGFNAVLGIYLFQGFVSYE